MAAHRGYSTWDRWLNARWIAPIVDRKPGERKFNARCRTRIAAFKLALDGTNDDAGSLSAELAARRTHWRARFAPKGNLARLDAVARRTPNRAVLRMNLVWLPLIVLVSVMSFVPLLFGSHVMMPVTLNLFLPVMMAPFSLLMRPHARMVRAVVRSLCPDCEYSLSELPDAIELPGDERTGPAICPECGCSWPLIPPRGR